MQTETGLSFNEVYEALGFSGRGLVRGNLIEARTMSG